MTDYHWPDHKWKTRARIIANAVEPGGAVLDMGGGLETLRKYLRDPRVYVSVDKVQCTESTIVADFNKGEYPELSEKFDVVVAQGLIEYLDDPAAFLQAAKRYAPKLIVTYLSSASVEAVEKGRVTALSMRDFRALLTAAGWQVSKIKAYAPQHCVFVCKLPGVSTEKA